MKMALNGALTIGTLDGANIEIRQSVGPENFFLFGLNARDVEEMKKAGYHPADYYHGIPELRRALDMISDGFFSPQRKDTFQPITETLLRNGDPFFILADFASYLACQRSVEAAYLDQEAWLTKSILNVAHMGYFSSDRTIREYARDIWQIKV
jgi:starch phosphorylase